MKPAKILQLLTVVSLVMLLGLAPAAAAAAQRRTTRAPQRRSTTPARPATRTTPPAPAAQPQQSARPATRRPARAQDVDPPGASEIDRPFSETVGGEGYALYVELRSLGRLLRSKEAKDLLGLIQLVGGGMKEVEDHVNFFTAHIEQFEGVNSYAVMMPTRAALPQFIGAYEFPTADAARSFEPKLRGIMEKYEKLYVSGEPGAPAPAASPAAAGGRQPPKTAAAPETAGAKLVLKRYGRLIMVSDEPFTLRRLRGETEQPLAGNARLQSLRSRLSTEPLFLFYDVTLLERSGEVARERMEQQSREVNPEVTTVPVGEAGEAQMRAEAMRRQAEAEAAAQVSGEMQQIAPVNTEPESPVDGEGDEPPPPGAVVVGGVQKQSPEEQEAGQASRATEFLFSSLFSVSMFSVTRWPEAVGAALDLDGDAFVVRAVLLNAAANEVLPLPFVPTLISGPQITSQAASVAPADSEVFISASLDLTRMFNRMVGTLDETYKAEANVQRRVNAKVANAKSAEEERSAEKSLAAAEKLLGFGIREDFLPAIGNEVALSVPLSWFTGERGYNYGYRGREKEEGGGIVLLVSLNNVEGVQRMLPRLLGLMGIKPLADPGQTTSHAGYQMHQYGGLTIAYLNNFAALSWDADSVRRFIDSASAHGPLSADERFRAATSWSPRQKLAEAYVSRALVESLYAEVTKWADPEDAEVQQAIARLNIRPEPVSYAVTGEGGTLLAHELRLPTALVKLFVSDSVVGRKSAPLKQAEQSALSILQTTRSSQEARKAAKTSYGTFEELSTPGGEEEQRMRRYMKDYEHPLSKTALDKMGYLFELRVAGDKYTLTATPKEYRKTGRRSFYLDETGLIRAADHAGEPATVNDPPID
jgi:hypothetical protein